MLLYQWFVSTLFILVYDKMKLLKLSGGWLWGLSLDVTGESEVLQRIALVWGAGAGQRQAGDLAAKPKPPLLVQGAISPVLLPSSKAAIMYGHVG